MKRQRRYLPTLIDQLEAFKLPDQIFDQLKRGEIDSIKGEPYFKDHSNGQWYEVHAAMNGWCEAWARLVRRYNLAINLAPMLQLSNRLHHGTPVTEELVAECAEILEQARRAYRGMDTRVVWQIIQTTCIQIKLEDAGVIPREQVAA
jgi:hypothetical protein